MSTKVDKKKKREKEVKKKLELRRVANQIKNREARKLEKDQRDLQRVANRLEGKTIKNVKEEDVLDKLSHNLEILEALEEEQKALAKAQNNVEMINTNGIPMKENQGLSASADVVFIPNPEKSE
jgi:DNA repair exonuclease SbcCD ATPase subunit